MEGGDRGRRDPLARRLDEHLERTGLIRSGDAVLVALSGGLDSVVLLHLLRFGLPRLGLELRAAHVDHRMRPGSGADALWVRGLCAAWGVPLETRRLDPPPRGEESARSARYAALRDVARKHEAVATAHHADDQAETLLFRLARGTGIRGLRGIAPRRGRLVRPLLPFTRAELEAFALERRLSWRSDPTNLDLGFARNHIRHQVLPALEAVRPGVVPALARLADHARANEAAWDSVARRLESELLRSADPTVAVLARDTLLSYHPQVRARILRRVLRRYGCMPDRAGTHAALEFIRSGTSGGGVDLPGGVRLERSFDEIRLTLDDDASPADSPAVIPGPGAGAAAARVGGATWRIRWGPATELATEAASAGAGGVNAHRLRLDPAAWAFPLELRGWEPGDRIRLDYGTKKLKKLLAEARIGRHARHRVPVLADAEGRVLWVVGVAKSADAGSPGTDFTISVADGGE